MKTTNPEVKRIAKAAFPGYKGRKFRVEVTAKPRAYQNYWDEGSREYIKAVNLATGEAFEPSLKSQNPFHPRAHVEVAPIPGAAIVCHDIFCGKDVGLTVYVHPNDVTPALGVGEAA